MGLPVCKQKTGLIKFFLAWLANGMRTSQWKRIYKKTMNALCALMLRVVTAAFGLPCEATVWYVLRGGVVCTRPTTLHPQSTLQPAFFFPSSLFASGTQLPHLTFSIWPLPRGEIARVSKRGCHTSWILLSFNLPSPFSPWPCTWIRDEDIAQLWEYLMWLPRSKRGYFGDIWRFWCIMDMDIGFITFVWCDDICGAKERNVYIWSFDSCLSFVSPRTPHPKKKMKWNVSGNKLCQPFIGIQQEYK